jgi:hypothetical protein
MENGFCHELKFLISQSSALLLKRRLRGIMQPDPHAGPTGQYTIRSLYFDDQNYSAYNDKMDGVSDRIKYRIRFYNNDTTHIRLEKKEKHRDLTKKTGATITLADALHLEQRTDGPCPDTDGALVRELRAFLKMGGHSAILVEYDRTPFVCNAGQTRITIDEQIRTRPYEPRLLASGEGMIPVLEEGMAVLEVKFNDFLPGVLAEALEDVPKASLAVSKYVLCINTI